jgi:NAD-dependent deacetylase
LRQATRQDTIARVIPLPRVAPGSEFAPIPIRRGTRVFVLTGAGISAESGIRTFRDAGGLWEEHNLEDVATPEGFVRNPRLVWRFYSQRRVQATGVAPNPAHHALARLGEFLGDDLFLCTQNVDPLHERAGSRGVLHMHGELLRTCCSACDRPSFADEEAYEHGPPTCECGALLRPDVVWFGEMPKGMDEIGTAVSNCDLFLTVGSSGSVYPAAGLVSHVRNFPSPRTGRFARTIYVGIERPENAHAFDECRLGRAGELLPHLFEFQD